MQLEWVQLRYSPEYRVGLGFDAHKLRPGRRLVLGSVVIPYSLGLSGHSDADVLLHALMDALLGAATLPDIGTLFPDKDDRFRDADSTVLLRQVLRRVRAKGLRVENVCCILVCDAPKIEPHARCIRNRLAVLLGLDPGCIGMSAKTTEGTRLADKRSIAALATALLARRPRR
jgi:2-C-methyl-D-erythritol 2,4-cyclodiphosphate synthase